MIMHGNYRNLGDPVSSVNWRNEEPAACDSNTHSVAGEKVGRHDRRGRKSEGLQEVGLTHNRGVVP